MTCRPISSPEGKMKSKFVTNKTNATKEIEAWVRGGDEFHGKDAVRMSGQLTDNVTEERMLKAKLWELSRERYKFLSQNAYERKLFVDRIQRKSSASKRNLLQTERFGKDQLDGRRVKSSNARLALLDRLDPTKSRDRPKEFKDAEPKSGSSKGPKFVHFGEDVVSESPDKTKLQTRQQLAVLSEQNLARRNASQRSYSASHCRVLPSLTDGSVQKSEDTNSQNTIELDGSALTGNIRTWAVKRMKTGSISSSSSSLNYIRISNDPRLTKLEGALSPLYTTGVCPDVKAIVRDIGSLHLPPRINKETTKPKTTMKIMDYIRTIGLTRPT